MKRFLIAVLGIVLGLGLSGAFVSAHEGHDHPVKDPRALGSTLEVHINNSGKVLVRGAQVTAVSEANITATTAFGGYTMTWTVKTDEDTRFVRKHLGASNVSEISVGDIISFSGIFDLSATTPTVNADVVKDWSIERRDQTLAGTIASVNSGASSFVLHTERRGDVTVQTNATTEIMSGTTTASFSAITVGARAKVRGALNTNTNTLTATLVRLLPAGE